MKATAFFLVLFGFSPCAISQDYPTFGPEKVVTINGLSFDAMEPFISPDGNTLFFNSLNSGGNTNLYYASRINDTTFNYVGLVDGTYDPSPDHLDAVASMDSAENFFWVSLRNIPNLHTGNYLAGTVSDLSQVFGTCNILAPPGWIIMDAAIDYQGNLLYYSNGYFGPTYTECVGIPCEAILGIAEKVNDTTFHKTTNSDAILSNINDPNYLIYAPQVTADGLELYFTRILDGTTNTEICVSVRNTVSDTFSLPTIIYSNFGYFPEAASPTTDKEKIYYHRKNDALTYAIYLRYRTGSTATAQEQTKPSKIEVYPNPAENVLHILVPDPAEHFTLTLCNAQGQEIFKTSDCATIDLSNFASGVYFLTVNQADLFWTSKIMKD